MRYTRTVGILGLALFLTALSGPVHAGDTREKERTALFREGMALVDQKDWQKAAEKLRAVIAIRSAPKALLALALVEEQLGHLLQAKALFMQAASDAHAAHLAEDEKTAVSALTLLIPRIPRLLVQLPAGSNARVLVDSIEVRPAAEGIELDPGVHELVVEEFQKTVRLEEKQRVEIVVQPRSVPGPPVAAPTQVLTTTRSSEANPPRERAGRPIAALTVGAAGLVVGGAGALFLALGKGQESDAKAQCPGGGTTACPESARSDADGSRTKIIVGDVLIGVGAAAVITGGIWWLVSGGAEPAARKTGIVVGPTGVAYRGIF